MKIACFIAFGYSSNKINVDNIIKGLFSINDDIQIDVYVGWNKRGNVWRWKKGKWDLSMPDAAGKNGIKWARRMKEPGPNIVNGYTYTGKIPKNHSLNVIEIESEPQKMSQKAYYTWQNLMTHKDIKKGYDKYLFFKDTYCNKNESIVDAWEGMKDKEFILAVSGYYGIPETGHPQSSSWNLPKAKETSYFSKTGLRYCSDTKLMCMSPEGFNKIVESGFFNKGIKKKQFSIIRFFMPEHKIWSVRENEYLNI